MDIDWTTRKIYGSLGKVGIATPAGGDTAITDFHRNLHEDIVVSDVQVPMESLTPQGLKTMSERVADAMGILRDYNSIQLAFFSCTSGSLIGGKGYDAYLCRVLKEAAGTPCAYTTTTAVLKALRTIGAKKLSICTPYPDDINRQEKEYFETEGFVINNIDGMKTPDPRDPKHILRIAPEKIYNFALEHMHPDSDVMFLSCTGLTTSDIIQDLEKKLSVPVITSNQAAAWLIGCYFGAHSKRAEKLGELFRYTPADETA